jgi:hypothetical protein
MIVRVCVCIALKDGEVDLRIVHWALWSSPDFIIMRAAVISMSVQFLSRIAESDMSVRLLGSDDLRSIVQAPCQTVQYVKVY